MHTVSAPFGVVRMGWRIWEVLRGVVVLPCDLLLFGLFYPINSRELRDLQAKQRRQNVLKQRNSREREDKKP